PGAALRALVVVAAGADQKRSRRQGATSRPARGMEAAPGAAAVGRRRIGRFTARGILLLGATRRPDCALRRTHARGGRVGARGAADARFPGARRSFALAARSPAGTRAALFPCRPQPALHG